tara:strand:- start:3914 stop:4051 length:138 start_codon:yes stop_codon:yes gene_type:complete
MKPGFHLFFDRRRKTLNNETPIDIYWGDWGDTQIIEDLRIQNQSK